MEPDIGRESQFLPIPPAYPIYPSTCLSHRCPGKKIFGKKHGKNILKIRTWNVTDGWTDRWTDTTQWHRLRFAEHHAAKN